MGLPSCEGQIAAQTDVPIGCFFYGWRFSPGMKNLTQNPVRSVYSTVECQHTCQQTGGCRFFSFEPEADACWLVDYTMNKFEKRDTLYHYHISGMRECDFDISPLCSDMPGEGFPGDTAEMSEQAWPSGLVPPKLQCWPRSKDEALVSCNEQITVLDDARTGWRGKCFGLDERPDIKDAKECEELCREQQGCSVWQMVDWDWGSHCWLGKGEDCLRGGRHVVLEGTQRIMRGSVRVLMDLAGWEVMQLKQAFPPIPPNDPELGHDIEDIITECNHTCLAAIDCEVWQYSTTAGCMVNDPSFKQIAYPPTRNTFVKDSRNARSVLAGAYVQRLCLPSSDRAPAPSPAPAPTIAIVVTDRDIALDQSESSTPAVTATTTTATTTSATVTSASSTSVTPTTHTQSTETTTATRTTGTTVTSTTTSATSATTSATILAVLAPKAGEKDMFIKGHAPQEIYFRDGETATKHLVRLQACMECDSEVQEACSTPSQVPEGEVLGLPTGEDFECNMFDGGRVKPIETRIDPVGPQTNPPTTVTTVTKTTDTSTTAGTTVELAADAGDTDDGDGDGGFPWWAWLLIVLALLCCIGFCIFAYLSVQKSKAAEREKRKAKLQPADSMDSEESTFDDAYDMSDEESPEHHTPLMDQAVVEPMGPAPHAAATPPTAPVPSVTPPYVPPGRPTGLSGQFPPYTSGFSTPGMSGYMPSPMPTSQGSQLLDMDLVTVTPQGLAVTPLNGNPPPAGVPYLEDLQQDLQRSRQPPPPHPQDMDLVTVTPQGLAVTPLHGNPPPPGVPYLH